jgi:alpha-tubulin suppressor-like RCC1 family protein
MKALRRWRLARLASCAALALGLAGTAVAGSPPAQARVTSLTSNRQVAMFWGANRITPFQETGLTEVIQVSAGGLHSLALRSDGTVWAWGNNFFGQLGNGYSCVCSIGTPAQVAGLTGVIQVAAGAIHSLALRSDGTVWAWGDDGTGSDRSTPAQVTGLTGVTKISAGDRFSLALRSDGTVWAWGANQAGQLGNGTTANSPVPVQVTGLSQVTGISAGVDASLATRTTGITALTSVWTWGGNASGQLGDGTFTSHLAPERVTGINTPYIAGISAGHNFAVVLGTDGSAWGWGADESGELDNTPTSNPVSRPVQMTGAGSGITQLSAGFDHVLALKSNGTVRAWGGNSEGQLGNGSTTSTTGPVQVSGLTGVSQVSAGGLFSLAVRVLPWVILPLKR